MTDTFLSRYPGGLQTGLLSGDKSGLTSKVDTLDISTFSYCTGTLLRSTFGRSWSSDPSLETFRLGLLKGLRNLVDTLEGGVEGDEDGEEFLRPLN